MYLFATCSWAIGPSTFVVTGGISMSESKILEAVEALEMKNSENPKIGRKNIPKVRTERASVALLWGPAQPLYIFQESETRLAMFQVSYW